VDEKKPPDSLAVFRVSVDSRVLPTLSIRQRPEMPKKVKVKLRRGGHGGSDRAANCLKGASKR
jgi:hypothetical protein